MHSGVRSPAALGWQARWPHSVSASAGAAGIGSSRAARLPRPKSRALRSVWRESAHTWRIRVPYRVAASAGAAASRAAASAPDFDQIGVRTAPGLIRHTSMPCSSRG